MKITLWTAAATGLLALCVSSCGGGKDYATEVCNRLQGCGAVSLESGATTVADCEKSVNQNLNALSSSERAAAEKRADQCLAIQDCPGLTSCLYSSATSPGTSVGTDYASMICNKLSSCGSLSQVGMTTVSQCITTANQGLSRIPASQRAQVNTEIDMCLGLTCESATQCIVSLTSSLP
jgi:hypothetical protein